MSLQINLRQSGRRSRQWNLGEELSSRFQPMHFSAPFGIMGGTGVGRKSLALRFAAMDANNLPNEPPQPFYSSFHKRTVRINENLRSVTLHLHAYICPSSPGSRPSPPFYFHEWDRFCCLVFLFDVTKRETFHVVKCFMTTHDDEPFKSILVGNKCDLRASVPERNAVPKEAAEAEALRRGMTYYECSATMKTNVQKLLEAIEDDALEQKYVMNL